MERFTLRIHKDIQAVIDEIVDKQPGSNPNAVINHLLKYALETAFEKGLMREASLQIKEHVHIKGRKINMEEFEELLKRVKTEFGFPELVIIGLLPDKREESI